MKKSVKILITCCALLIVAVCFCGCSSVRQMTIFNQDGTVNENVYVTLNKNKIEEAGEDFLEVKSYVQNLAQTVATQLANNFNASNPTENGDDIVKVENVRWQDEESFVVGLKFNSEDAYKKFYGITDNNTATMQEEKHFFYTKYYRTGCCLYVAEGSLISLIRSQVVHAYPSFINEQEELLFTYEMDSYHQHSDADYITKKDGKYYHTWVVESDNLDKPVTFYYIIANRANIILVCIIISLLVCGTLCLFLLKKKKNKKEKEL